MTIEQILEILENYKLRIPPTVFYDLKADIVNFEAATSYKWCTDCREYDQEKHCCHRWSKVIRNTVEEMKQEYIEREVLDEIRAEIEELPTYDPKFEEKYTAYGMRCDVLEILDKYKAESEPQESEDKCKNCKYYLNPDYTRCHECKAESER